LRCLIGNYLIKNLGAGKRRFQDFLYFFTLLF